MISYRQHIISLVAVFLALAVGLALGGGVLAEADDDPGARPADTPGAAAQRAVALGDDFALKAAPVLYGGRLSGHPVALVTLPGADERDVTALTEQVAAAGAGIAGRYDLREGLVSAGEKTLVETLGAQLAEEQAPAGVDVDASTYVRLGQLLGTAVASAVPAGEPIADVAVNVRESLVAAELLTVGKDPVRRAPLVLVVLGDDVEPAILSGLVSGLATTSTGVVVAGSAASGASGDLAALRAHPAGEAVTTVDGVESPLGRVSAVLALARELAGTGGSFGASGSDGAVPLG